MSLNDELNTLLADYQVFYQKLRGYHWNVKGPLFFGLHEKFEELYLAAALNVDELAERVAAQGGKPLSTMADQLAAARLSEDGGSPGGNEMVANLRADLQTLNGSLRETAGHAAEAGDDVTEDLLKGMAAEQEKTAWMLGAFLAES